MKIYFATDNLKKFKEMSFLLPFPIEQFSIDLKEIQGRVEEISKDKAVYAYNMLQKNEIVLVDDVSLEIESLNNFPGPYIKHFMKIGYENIEKILKVCGRRAKAICCLTICYKEANDEIKTHTVSGYVKGELMDRTDFDQKTAFGFDPIFLPANCDKTFGEMGLHDKTSVSHRAVAVKKLLDVIDKLNLVKE